MVARLLLILALLLVLPAMAGEDRAERVHQQLFEVFFPLEGLDPDLVAQAVVDRHWMFQEFERQPALKAMLASLPDEVLTPEGFARWQTSPDAASATRLRQLYVSRIYAWELGREMAGLPPLPERLVPAPLRLPGSRLENRGDVLIHPDGPIDWAIVGSGPAGAVLAHELTRAGKRVVLIDQGPFPPTNLDPREIPELKDAGGARPTADGLVLVRNGRAMGGGSTVNIDLAFAPTLPMVRDRLERWRREGRLDPDWFSDENVAEAYRWVVDTIGTRTPAMAEVNPNNRILWDGALASGLQPRLYDLNTRPDGTKLGAVDRLIRPVMDQGLQVLPECRVDRILVEGGAVRGLEVSGQPRWGPGSSLLEPGRTARLAARQVALCAGAQGTALLMNATSGVVLHPSVPLAAEFDHRIDILDGTPSTVYAEGPAGVIFESTSAGPDYLALMVPGAGRPLQDLVRRFPHLGGFGVMLVDTRDPANRVERGEDGQPRVTYRLTDGDRKRLAAGVAEGIRILFRAGATRVIVPTSEDVLGDGRSAFLDRIEQADLVEERLQFLPGRTLLTSAHMQSTFPLGTDRLSPRGEVVGVRGLYVMDASVFPESVGANPMQTVYTFAKITADHLAHPSP